MSSEPLHVIALISGGKDSFYSLLHCIHHGHRIVALANLFPVGTNGSSTSDDGVKFIDPTQPLIDSALQKGSQACADELDGEGGRGRDDDTDLNSFMYQTVGHEVIPLYAAATGLPLYRQPIRGAAVHHERDYAYDSSRRDVSASEVLQEETESMIPLLRFVKARHPEANAICSGAILSTYQRTRVESVALRLGLTPLAYLWKYTVLPSLVDVQPDEAQLLRDMAMAGLEARIIKVASAGLDQSHLWEQVSSDLGVDRVKKALRRFGAAEGAALGEGGEFETIVLDGPSRLFKKSIAVSDSNRVVIREGGGSNWLMLRGARLRDKPPAIDAEMPIRVPRLLDSRFDSILDAISAPDTPSTKWAGDDVAGHEISSIIGKKKSIILDERAEIVRWCLLSGPGHDNSIESETQSVAEGIKQLLLSASLDAAHITTTVVIIRNMSDFPKVNAEYGKLFVMPNPPSRITISCGDLLPDGHNIMVYVTAPNAAARVERDGLHVQSRSYWAPANIGPYSQAIDVAVTARQAPTGVRSVYIAGQIPLIPSSMVLPGPSEASYKPLQLQIALSLQHLWRIGIEKKVQLWTSAVAYFARSSSASEMEGYAKLASLAWKLAHVLTKDEEDKGEDEEADEDGPDLWDLKYNYQYMTLGGSAAQRTRASLPDWSVLTLRQRNEPGCCVPPFFAVEVEELPRQSAVEWHAHTGLSGIGEGDAELVHQTKLGATGWKAWHMVVRTERAHLVYTVLALDLSESPCDLTSGPDDVRGAMTTSYRDSVCRLGVDVPDRVPEDPYIVYLDLTGMNGGLAAWVEPCGDGGGMKLPFSVVPCRSIWSMSGARVGCVALFKLTLQYE